MNAKTAANNVYHYQEKYGPGRCGSILSEIEILSKRGVSVLTCDFKITEPEKAHLESLGFKVTERKLYFGFLGKKTKHETEVKW